MKNDFSGVGVALVTPFDRAGNVDYEGLGRLVDSVIAGGADYLLTLGTTAEPPTLSPQERASVAAFIRERNDGRLPLVIGIGGNCTADVVQAVAQTDTAGFDAILSVTPYYNKPSQEGLFRHYRAVAEATPLPVILYNVPGRTSVNIAADTALRIAREVPNVIGIKEASGNLDQIRAVIDGAPKGFRVISGDDSLTLPIVKMGGVGVISVAANVYTEPFCRMVHAALAGDWATAESVWGVLEEPVRLLFEEGNPTGVKAALAVKGLIRPGVRLPLVEGSRSLMDRLAALIGERGL